MMEKSANISFFFRSYKVAEFRHFCKIFCFCFSWPKSDPFLEFTKDLKSDFLPPRKEIASKVHQGNYEAYNSRSDKKKTDE